MAANRYLLLLVCFAIFSCHTEQKKTTIASVLPKERVAVQSFPEKDNFWLFLMAGQSNSSGRDRISAEDTLINKRILLLDRANNWVYAQEPFFTEENTKPGLSAGLAFGNYLTAHLPDEITIGIVPYSKGGSRISDWLVGSLYQSWKKKALLAMAQGSLKGMLWIQGESDAGPDYNSNYEADLQILIQQMRSDLHTSDLPFYIAEIPDFSTRKENTYPLAINAAIHKVAAKIPGVYIIHTEDLPLVDRSHFSAAAQRELGMRYAGHVLKNL